MDDMELRIVESICCVRCGAQCEEEPAGDLLTYTCPEDGTRHVLTVKAPTEVAVVAGDDPLVGQTLGPCRIVRRAGAEGGLPIYDGLHVSLNHPHTVRVLAGAAARERARLERFVRTSRFAAAVRHAAIANVVHLGKLPGGGGLFAVSAALEGAPLDQALGAGGRLAVRDALRLARLLAEALAGLHARGIVHRNLGPKTVYLSPTRAPLLCHFAAATGPDVPPEPETVVGQPGYLPPEQATGGAVDGRADLYALGALVYLAVAGRPAFGGSDPSDVVRNQLAGKPPERGPLTAAAPPVFADLVLELLAPDPDERPVDAQVVLDALASVEGQLVAAAPAPAADEAPALGALALDEGQLSIVEPGEPPAAAPEPEPEPAAEPFAPPISPEAAEPETVPPPTIAHPALEAQATADEAPPPAVEPVEAELAGPELPEPDEAPSPAQEKPAGVLGELVLATEDAGGPAQAAVVHEEAEEAKPSLWQTQRRAIVMLGVLVALAVGWGAWKLLFAPQPAVIEPQPAPTTKGGPKKPATKTREPTLEEKLEKEAERALEKLRFFVEKNPRRHEEVVQRCDEFLADFAKTAAAADAYEFRQTARLRLREMQAEKELRDVAFLSDPRKPYTERLAAMDALLAKHADLKAEKVVAALKSAKARRDDFMKRSEETATRAYDAWKRQSEQPLAKNAFGRPLDALVKLVGEHKGTKAGNEAAAALTQLQERVTGLYQERKTRAEELVAQCSFDEAAALFEDPIEVWQIEAMQTESEALVATLRERRAAVVAGYGAFLAKFDALVRACRCAEAQAVARAAAAGAKEPVLEALFEGKAHEAQTLLGVLERVAAGAKAQAAALKPGETMWVELGRSRFKGTIASPDAEGVEIDTPIRKGKVTWGELSRAQLVRFAASAKPEPKPADHVAFGLLALTGGELGAAGEQFAAALDADEACADAIVAVLRRGAQGMVHIPAGEVLAGTQKTGTDVTGVLLGAHEVTNAEYALYCRIAGAQPPPHWRDGKYLRGHDEYPVTHVTWAEADAFAQWLAMRLPTDLEWEKGARGPDGRVYPWGDEFRRGLATVTPSELIKDKRKPPRARLVRATRARVKDYPFPLHHIVGNAREWTSTPVAGGRGGASHYVVGGSAADTEKEALAHARGKQADVERDAFTGFRLAWPR